MADQRISELNAITGANTADDDLFVIVDTSTNETKKITKSELTTTINNALIDGAPATLDTLNELAAALSDDANFATTVTNSLAGKVDTSGDTMTGNLNFGDNDKAIFGAGSDLQIYHDGSNSRITDSGTGDILIDSANLSVRSSDGSKLLLKAFDTGAIKLYNGTGANEKLATTSTGIDVTGTATMDGLTVDGVSKSNYSVATDSLAAFESGAGVYTYTSGGIGVLAAYSSGATKGLLKLDASDLQVAKGSQKIISADGNGDISFYEDTGTTAKFFWDASAERLGIGTSSPNDSLHVVGNIRLDGSGTPSGDTAQIYNAAGVGPTINGYQFAVRTGEAERMRIDSSGNVGIGTSSPATKLAVSGGYISQTNAGVSTYLGEDGSGGALVGTTTNNYFRFITNDTERMRIDSSGNLLVGVTSSPYPSGGVNGIAIQQNGVIVTSHTGTVGSHRYLSANGTMERFYIGSTAVGSISVSGSSTAYNTSSDYRLKEDWKPVANASDRVAQLKPVNFAWKVDGTRVDGFLAHELAEVIPEAVTGTKDAMRNEEYEVSPAVLDDEGNVVTEAVMGEREVPDYQGIDQSKLVPLLTAALQEALTRIETLEAKVAVLENN